MRENEFGMMVEGYIPSLTRNALKFTKDAEDANDLVQDTLVKAIRFYKNFEPETNLKGWLFVIMKNTFLNNCRSEARKRQFITPAEEISSANLLYSANQNKATGSLIVADVNVALNKLPEFYRIPFVRYVEGYKYQEIADELNIPLGTVKTRIHEARILLKRQLKIYAG